MKTLKNFDELNRDELKNIIGGEETIIVEGLVNEDDNNDEDAEKLSTFGEALVYLESKLSA